MQWRLPLHQDLIASLEKERKEHLKGVTQRPSSRPHCLPFGCPSCLSASCSCQADARARALPLWRAVALGSRGRPVRLALPLPSLAAHTVGWQGSQGGSMPSAVPQHTNSWTTWSKVGQSAGCRGGPRGEGSALQHLGNT